MRQEAKYWSMAILESTSKEYPSGRTGRKQFTEEHRRVD